jgi:predicted DsbA family dithiol-disulfide isomerase
MRVDVWSDVVCPWCYIGFVRLNNVLDRQQDDFEVYYHSFQLDKEAENSGKLAVQHLAEKFGIHVDDAKGMMMQVSEVACGVGLEYYLDKTIHGNTRLTHRLLHLAATLGVQKDLLSLLFRSYFEEALPIFAPEQLQPLALSVGISDLQFRSLLETDIYEDIVAFDLQLADQLQIQGVPFFVFNQSVAVAGAEAEEVFEAAIAKARESEDLETPME